MDEAMNALLLKVRNVVDLTLWYDLSDEEAIYCNACNAETFRHHDKRNHREDCALVELCELLGWPIPQRP